MSIQVISTLLVLIPSVFIYKKYKTESEEFILLKLVGYYLLGSFRFNFNKVALPAGFIIYLMFFRPQINKSVKNKITYLGLLVFICGILSPFIQKSYFERQRVVNGSSTNIYTIDFKRDYDAIKQKLGISESTKLEDFNASFDGSGAITELRYTLITKYATGIVLYHVNFLSNKKKYIIKPIKVSEWLQYDRLINDDQFLYVLKNLDLKQIKPQEEYPFYTIGCRGDCTSWGVKDFENFLITTNGLKKLSNEELPVDGYSFWIYGNKKTSANSYTNDSNIAYILPRYK